MIYDSSVQASPRMRLALLALGFILLTGLLVEILSGGRGVLFLQALLAGIGILWLFKEPHWGVLTVLAMWFLQFSPALLGIRHLSVPYIISALLLIPLLMAIWQDRDIWVVRVPQVKLLLGIGLMFLISAVWNHYKHPVIWIPELNQTREMMQLFVTRLIFLIFFLYFINTRRKIELAVWVILVLIIASGVNAFYHFLLPGAGRAWASFGIGRNANRLAYLCLFGASLLWFYRAYAADEKWKKLIWVPLFPLPAIALASGSRAGFIQTIIFVALAVKEQEGWSVTKRVRSILFLGAVSLVFLTVVPTTTLLRATTFESSASAPGGESLTNRLNTIYAAVEMVAQDPIFGVGLGNFRWMHQAYFGSNLLTHNSFLWALVSGGIGVLILYVMLFGVTYRMLRQLEKYGPHELLWISKGLRINLILFMIASTFADLWHSDFVYVFVGLTVAMIVLQYRMKQQAQHVPYRPYSTLVQESKR